MNSGETLDEYDWVQGDVLKAMPFKATYYWLKRRLQKDETFPRPQPISERKLGWKRNEILEWIRNTYGDAHARVTVRDDRKPSKRPERLKRNRNVKRT